MTTYHPQQLLEKAIKEFGTPLYAYDARLIESQFLRLKRSLGRIPSQISYAVKANSNLSILNLCNRLGAGFDIVSGGELHRVLKSGGDASQVVFAGVGKTTEEIRFGLYSGIRFFNVESSAELKIIQAIAEAEKMTANVSFRINPHVLVKTHPYLATGLESSKFGIPSKEIPALWESVRNSQSIKVIGVDCHIGSQINDVEPLQEAYTEILTVADALRTSGAPIAYVDFGGGFGVSFSGHYEPLNIEAFGEMVQTLMKDRPYFTILEPGKYLVSEAGVLLTDVLYTKNNGSKRFVITSAGMNDLIRPSLYEAYHKIEVLGKEQEAETETVDVVGPVCESGCYFAHDRKLPPISAGDVLVIKDAGAYGFSMASNYNSRPLPAEILIESETSYKLIRRRETVDELYKNEIL